jgi:hypothetical protein
MKHLSPKYRKRRTPQQQREFRNAQSRRISRRWAKQHLAMASEPVRQTRVTRITIEDSHRMRLVVTLHRDQAQVGWGRARVTENGKAVHGKWGTRQLGLNLARMLT